MKINSSFKQHLPYFGANALATLVTYLAYEIIIYVLSTTTMGLAVSLLLNSLLILMAIFTAVAWLFTIFSFIKTLRKTS